VHRAQYAFRHPNLQIPPAQANSFAPARNNDRQPTFIPVVPFRRVPMPHRFIAALVLLSLSGVPGAAQPSDGATVYTNAKCFACHGQMGGGGVGPRLAGDRMLAISQFVAARILLGTSVMPTFADSLKDDEIAAVATYVRTNWGNHFGEVSAGDVKETRKLLGVPEPHTAGAK